MQLALEHIGFHIMHMSACRQDQQIGNDTVDRVQVQLMVKERRNRSVMANGWMASKSAKDWNPSTFSPGKCSPFALTATHT